ncbi:MAG: glycosyltransferase [Micrococcales bacterium]|nr:glycosyltransferase [Micrococcales bacterium]
MVEPTTTERRARRWALGLTVAYLLVTGVKVALARAALRESASLREQSPPGSSQAPPVTVLVPVRSGDPQLASVLTEQAEGLAGARVLLCVDEDDPNAVRVAEQVAASALETVEVRRFAPPPTDQNPKVAKLALAAAQVPDGLIALLDDDTVLPPGALARAVAALADADLVTGVPVYREQGEVWSRLLAAFVNGSSLLTYLPAARLAAPVTVNGMFVVTTTEALARAGGLDEIAHEVCDDYALARAYRRAGLRIAQTTVVHPLVTTVPGPVAYASQMRRWMLFATQVLHRDPSPVLLGLVVVPSVLPSAMLATAVRAGGAAPAAAVAAVGTKALATRWLRGQAGGPTGGAGVGLEIVSDLLLPVHLATALLGPRTVTWRGRRVRVRAPR